MLTRISSQLLRVAAPRMHIVARNPVRLMSGAAVSKLHNIIKSEHQMEKEQYEQIENIQKFLKDHPQWKLQDSDGEVTLKMIKSMGDKEVILEWQLVSPFGSDLGDFNSEDGNQEAQEDNMPMESTDFTITIQDKSGERGLIYYSQTAAGEGHRYMIGNVRSFASSAERDSDASYNGPDFEDLDDSLQESFDEFLAEAGINDEVCDFIDASAVDKEQREYMRWLKNVDSFIQA
jgi:complement component 1 Q subcomponent-binding protein